MNASTFDFLFDGSNWAWSSYDSFPHRILEHLQYSAIALVIAFVIAFPIGLLIGHTNRGSFLAINIGNAGRALPTLGVLMLVLVLVGTGLVPVVVALVILAIPPILTTTYAGIRSVSGATVDAARGVGMRERQIVTGVELPDRAADRLRRHPQRRAPGDLDSDHRGVRRAGRARSLPLRRPGPLGLPAGRRGLRCWSRCWP